MIVGNNISKNESRISDLLKILLNTPVKAFKIRFEIEREINELGTSPHFHRKTVRTIQKYYTDNKILQTITIKD